MKNEITLQEAIQYVKEVTPEDNPWSWEDFAIDGSSTSLKIDLCIATILNAVVSGDLVVNNDRD